jgi:hypothetical protein
LIRRLLVLSVVLLAAAACGPVQPAAIVPLPTLAVLPSAYPVENAERVAREFLQNWVDGNYARMFDLISFGRQEATPREQFLAVYEDSAATMTLAQVEVQANGIAREGESVAVLNYSVHFHTGRFGDLADDNRDMQLVVDAAAQDWRVAWTPADVFPELASGGRLRVRSAPPIRANIYDRNGQVLADQEGRVAMISIVRQNAPDWENCLGTLSSALSLPLEHRAPAPGEPPRQRARGDRADRPDQLCRRVGAARRLLRCAARRPAGAPLCQRHARAQSAGLRRLSG